jgi:hypothetical protein
VISDIALIVTAIGVIGGVLGLRQSYRERLRQFESRYVERYWQILDRLSLEALSGSCQDATSDSDNKAIRTYLYLCEDELEMRANGYIADRTYELWADGIKNQLEQSMFANIWKQVKEENRNGDMFPFVNLNNLINTDRIDYDPLAMTTWRRWLRGLAGLSGV